MVGLRGTGTCSRCGVRVCNVSSPGTGRRWRRESGRLNLACSVPLDYLNVSAGVAKIALGRYKATASNRKGSVFLNPGGPGGAGKSLATMAGAYFQRLVSAEVLSSFHHC